MKPRKCAITTLILLAALSGLGAERNASALKTFSASDSTISKDLKLTDDKAWLADCTKPQVIRLFEIADPGVEQCMITYRARLKSEGLDGQAYLEMWCRFPGKGEFFSRGLDAPVSGSNDWASYQTPFFLKKGEKPDLIKLNLVVKGTGKIWVKDVEVLKDRLSVEKGKAHGPGE